MTISFFGGSCFNISRTIITSFLTISLFNFSTIVFYYIISINSSNIHTIIETSDIILFIYINLELFAKVWEIFPIEFPEISCKLNISSNILICFFLSYRTKNNFTLIIINSRGDSNTRIVS